MLLEDTILKLQINGNLFCSAPHWSYSSQKSRWPKPLLGSKESWLTADGGKTVLDAYLQNKSRELHKIISLSLSLPLSYLHNSYLKIPQWIYKNLWACRPLPALTGCRLDFKRVQTAMRVARPVQAAALTPLLSLWCPPPLLFFCFSSLSLSL